MDTLTQDLRYALRALRRVPGFTAVAVLTLALGIGANTAVFTLVNAALFRSAPAANPDELAWLVATREFASGRERSYQRRLSYPEYVEYARRATAFSGLIAYSNVALALASGGPPERIDGLLVSANYFHVLGLVPAVGRFFAPEEDRVPGAHAVAVLGHDVWRRRFGGDTGLVGASITINGRPVTVVGVAPAGFIGVELGAPVQLWMPLAMQAVAMPRSPELLEQRAAGWLNVIGRLKPGVTRAAADAEVRTLAAQFAAAYPDTHERAGAEIAPVSGGLDPANRREGIPIFTLLMLVPGVVLVIACANVANLLLARATGRRREIGIRLALGATRGRLIRQLLTESVVLAILAGAAGALLSYWINDVLVAVSRAPSEVAMALIPDRRVFLFTAALTAATGVLFGLAPALGATRADLVPALRNEPGSARRRGRPSRLRGTFVVAQVAGSLVLLVTAGLFLRTLTKALRVDPGFDGHNVASASFDLGIQGYGDEHRGTFYARLLERARALPGVTAAALAAPVPLSGSMIGTLVMPEEAATDESGLPASLGAVSPGYFETLRLPLLRGRDFTARDDAGAPLVAIVNETLARRLWPGEDPLGRRLRLAGRDEPSREVVGVARDAKYDDLTERPRAFLYLPERQRADLSDITLVARTTGDTRALAEALRSALHELDANLPVFRVGAFDAVLMERLGPQRGAAGLLGTFGMLALVLAAVGLYGVIAQAVTQRTREIGVRIALGAGRLDVLRLFVGQGVRLAAIGVGIGLALAFGVTRLIARFLYGVGATDIATFAAGATVLCTVAALASWLPARRAAKVDPVVALRTE